MATFKHISSKNADYSAAEKYLTFEHDEFSMKPTLDENGRLGVQLSAPPEGNICPMEVQETSLCRGQNLPSSNTDKEYKDRIQTEKGEMRRRCGQYQNVFLSQNQYATLESDYPGSFKDYINRLSAYMEINGRHYANHYAVLRKWLDEDGKTAKNYDSEYTDKGDCL